MPTEKWRKDNLDKCRASRRKWYHSHKDHAKKMIKYRRAKLRAWFSEYKKTVFCVRCGEDDTVCLDFHHRSPRNGKRELTMATFIRRGFSKKKILDHIAKCDVVCANCHRKIHAGE
jgi:hypothetical protein